MERTSVDISASVQFSVIFFTIACSAFKKLRFFDFILTRFILPSCHRVNYFFIFLINPKNQSTFSSYLLNFCFLPSLWKAVVTLSTIRLVRKINKLFFCIILRSGWLRETTALKALERKLLFVPRSVSRHASSMYNHFVHNVLQQNFLKLISFTKETLDEHFFSSNLLYLHRFVIKWLVLIYDVDTRMFLCVAKSVSEKTLRSFAVDINSGAK
jgi:hypothetical protein